MTFVGVNTTSHSVRKHTQYVMSIVMSKVCLYLRAEGCYFFPTTKEVGNRKILKSKGGNS